MNNWKLNLYIVWSSQVLSLMSFNLGLPFFPFYIQELGVTDPDKIKFYAGVLSALPAITMGIMAPIWGILADRYGKKLMVLRSLLCGSMILLGMGLARTVEQIVILRLLQGLLTGTATAASTFIASNTPDDRLSYALGVLSSATFIGISAGPTFGGIISESVGYRNSFLIGSALLFIDFLVILFVLKDRTVYTKKEKTAGKKTFSLSHFLSVLSFTTVLMLVVLFLLRLTRSVFNPYIPLLVQENLQTIDGSSRITGYISGFAGLMTAFSGFTLSRLGDKFDKLKILGLFLSAGIVISTINILTEGLWSFAVMYGLMMFAIGGIEPVTMSLTSGSVPAEKRGMIFGLQGLIGCIGWAIAPAIGSYMSITYSIRSILYVFPLFLFLALLTVVWARRKNDGSEEEKFSIPQNHARSE
jgi:DHA1 family multidrug resistance protein-like MFS transporter